MIKAKHQLQDDDITKAQQYILRLDTGFGSISMHCSSAIRLRTRSRLYRRQ